MAVGSRVLSVRKVDNSTVRREAQSAAFKADVQSAYTLQDVIS